MSKRTEKIDEAANKFLNSLKEETPKIEELKQLMESLNTKLLVGETKYAKA